MPQSGSVVCSTSRTNPLTQMIRRKAKVTMAMWLRNLMNIIVWQVGQSLTQMSTYTRASSSSALYPSTTMRWRSSITIAYDLVRVFDTPQIIKRRQILNITGFRKALKKVEKATGVW